MDIDAYRWDKLRNLVHSGYGILVACGEDDEEEEEGPAVVVCIIPPDGENITLYGDTMDDIIDSISNPLQS